jgi:phosphohistidine swiveling domain-containing protein
MIKASLKEFSKIEWKRINMRNITHLLGVEFLHDLYNRHLPQINSIRFRNTIIIWKNKIANSYAPKEEWDTVAQYLGEKFLRLDKNLITEVKKLVNSKPKFLNKFLNNFPKNLAKLSNLELGLLLIDLHYFTLGELYKVNLVQLEHALTYAIDKLLKEHIKETQKRKEFFLIIISSPQLTQFQKEKIQFLKIVKRGQKLKIPDPTMNKDLYKLLFSHYEKYRFLHCAYGEEPRDFNFFKTTYKKLYKKEIKISSFYKEVLEKYKERTKFLRKIKDKRINILSDLMIKVGVFRDENKARLGNTEKYRLMILDEIARRKLEKRAFSNFYLLSEILDLLYTGKRLDRKTIKVRKEKGVTFYRQEFLTELTPSFINFGNKKTATKYLRGIIASPGICTGKCVVVFSKDDIKKLNKDKIMVAIGVDFDLLEGVYKSKGVITEEGGILSHASVVCRELGKPCCIGVKNATALLNNKIVKLDATKGIIKILA